jgi:hypothetical protein
MEIVSVFYAAFGYLALLGAILWGMLFVGDGVWFPNMDARGSAAPLEAAGVDLGLLLLLALLHRSVCRGLLGRFARWSIPRGLERSTQAWAAAAVLGLIYAGWQPLPQVLWNATGPLHWGLSALFYLAWTLILIGAFLASHLDLFEVTDAAGKAPASAADDAWSTQARDDGSPSENGPLMEALRQPLYGGILIAMWATTVMTVGHLLLAAAVTGYLLFDGLWTARRSGAPRAARGTFSLQGERLAR